MFILFVCLHSQIWKGSILILHICLCERGKKKKKKKKDALLPLSHVCVCVVRKRLCVKHYLQGKVKSCLPDSKWEQKEATIKVIIKRKNKNRKKKKTKNTPELGEVYYYNYYYYYIEGNASIVYTKLVSIPNLSPLEACNDEIQDAFRFNTQW